MPAPKKYIREIESVKGLVDQGNELLNLTIQDINLGEIELDWENVKIANTTFLGCEMPIELEVKLREKGATIFPKAIGLPYNPYRKSLYTWQELLEGFTPEQDESKDLHIYEHFESFRYSIDINEALSQRIHDHAIDDALRQEVGFDDSGMTEKKCVGVMGGHGAKRDDPVFEKVAKMTKALTEEGFYVMSGGGPGIMEAANFGAYFGGKTDEELKDALETLKVETDFKKAEYIIQAKKVVEKYPEGSANLAIPTWFYGHEPSNLFATAIAKYFSNSLREDVLLATALHGIVYAPGSAGTIQEIFADAAQNHYETYGYLSPMVFFDKKYWTEKYNVMPLLKQLSDGHKYGEMINIFDESQEVIDFIKKNPPAKG